MPGTPNGRTRMTARTAIESLRTGRLVFGIGCWAAAFVLYVVAVRTAPGRLVDDTAFQQLRDDLSTRSWIPDGTVLARSQLALLVIGAGVVCATCLVNRCTPRTTTVALVLACSPGLLADVLKGVLTRSSSPGEFVAHNSFPSGTVAAFAGVAAALAFLASSRLQQVVAAGACVGTGLVTLIVIRAHWHRPSDVVGALLIAIGAWAIASGAFAPRRQSDRGRTLPSAVSQGHSVDAVTQR